MLNPAKVPSWRASSYDLLTGLTVRDVTDTIPGAIFDELFKPVTDDGAGVPEGALNRRASTPASLADRPALRLRPLTSIRLPMAGASTWPSDVSACDIWCSSAASASAGDASVATLGPLPFSVDAS